MMNRQIEFRGIGLDGKMRYGFYAEDYGYPYIIENHTWHEVDPHSVAQLIGTDSHYKKVYERDTLTDEHGNKYIAVLEPVIEWQSNGNPMFRRVPIDFAKGFAEFTAEVANDESTD